MAVYFENAAACRCTTASLSGEMNITIDETLGFVNKAGNLMGMYGFKPYVNINVGDTLTCCKVWTLSAGFERLGVYASKAEAVRAYDMIVNDLKASGDHTFVAVLRDDRASALE